MKRTAIILLIVVVAPSLVLAWLALRSVRDQQFVIERQQALLLSASAETLNREINAKLAALQRSFRLEVESQLMRSDPGNAAREFDASLLNRWPLADVGFAVSLDGEILSPPPKAGRLEAREFLVENELFLSNRSSVPAYVNSSPMQEAAVPVGSLDAASALLATRYGINPSLPPRAQRQVEPQQRALAAPYAQSTEPAANTSRSVLIEGDFRQLIGDAREGSAARFVQDRLRLLFWYRPPSSSNLIFGAAVNLPRLAQELGSLFQPETSDVQPQTCLALLDERARPVAVSRTDFQAPSWKRPFVATEIGEALPHWEIAAYLVDPAWAGRYARNLVFTLAPTIGLLVLAIVAGSWIIVRDLQREVVLARQKTDFVSNVSHELKTPLTSIRMFAELLADGRVADPARQRDYLGIITAEAARLTRLINNVLDFARLERGQATYDFQPCNLNALVSETFDTLRPHLQSHGFALALDLPAAPIEVRADRDALAQVLLNLLSNAEKYSGAHRDIHVQLRRVDHPLPHAELRVLDRGLGVPRGCEEKIFEQFYRAHDALSNGIQGSGLGLTLARRFARAHGGDIACEPRPDGGACFTLRLPLPTTQTA